MALGYDAFVPTKEWLEKMREDEDRVPRNHNEMMTRPPISGEVNIFEKYGIELEEMVNEKPPTDLK